MGHFTQVKCNFNTCSIIQQLKCESAALIEAKDIFRLISVGTGTRYIQYQYRGTYSMPRLVTLT
jgi:hypothetical protein